MNDKTNIGYRIRRGWTALVLLVPVVGLLSGCSARDDMTGLSTDDSREIRLRAQDLTRSIHSLTDLASVGDQLGIYGVTVTDLSGSVPEGGWSSEHLVMDNVRTSDVDASTGEIHWAGSYLYPAETDRYVRFSVYHPYAAGDRFAVDASAGVPQLRFTLSGAEDLMFAGPAYGNVSRHPDQLLFSHRLTQLSFCVADAGGAFSGATLQEIAFTDVNTSGSMNLEDGSLGAWSTPSEIAVPGIDGVTISGTPESPQLVGGEVMLQPGCTSFRVRVVTSSGTFNNVEITPTSIHDGEVETSFAAGRAYRITLTFHERNELLLSASVIPWQMAGGGSAVIE